MLTNLVKPMMLPVLALGVMVASLQPAEARGRGRGLAIGLAAGIIGLGVAAAIADERRHRRHYYRSNGGCYPGPEECGWTNRRCFRNSWGDRVCRGGRYTCWRPTYCD